MHGIDFRNEGVAALFLPSFATATHGSLVRVFFTQERKKSKIWVWVIISCAVPIVLFIMIADTAWFRRLSKRRGQICKCWGILTNQNRRWTAAIIAWKWPPATYDIVDVLVRWWRPASSPADGLPLLLRLFHFFPFLIKLLVNRFNQWVFMQPRRFTWV